MAKLNKQKFNLVGYYNEERTTASGDIELTLYYNAEKEYFYFEDIELKKYLREEDIPMTSAYFRECDTKSKAIDAMTALIVKGGVETRYLKIELKMPSDLFKIPNPETIKSLGYDNHIIDPKFPKYLADMLDNIHSASGLSIGFERVIKLQVKDIKHYVYCDKDWKYNSKSLHGRGGNLIEWTEEREKFLIDIQEKLTKLCHIVLNYFNAGEDISELFKRMESGNSFLQLNK